MDGTCVTCVACAKVSHSLASYSGGISIAQALHFFASDNISADHSFGKQRRAVTRGCPKWLQSGAGREHLKCPPLIPGS